MARPADGVTALVALLRALGDEDYAALASVGLVRRAKKELGLAQLVEWVEGHAVVAVGTQTVRVPPAGPARASCSCPSPGVCQHVIAACLALVAEADAVSAAGSGAEIADMLAAVGVTAATSDGVTAPAIAPPAAPVAAAVPGAGAVATDPSPVPADAWSAVDAQVVRRWAGADQWRQAIELAQAAKVDTRPGGTAIVNFPDGTEARLPLGARLDGLITTAPARLRRRTLAAAVLAARRAEGWALAIDAADSWRVPAELLRALQVQLFECVRLGLNRLTTSTIGRLEIFAVQCRAAGVYRVARELESCATESRLILARDAQADPEQLLDRAAQLFALTEALLATERPDAELIGSARSDYEERAAVALVGCGGYRWRTPSGFHGLTVLFWDGEAGRFLSWTDSRPVGSGDGFDPSRRWRDAAPWSGGGSIEQLARGAFELQRPRVSGQRRLSGSASSRVERLATPTADDLPPSAIDWSALRGTLASSAALGLRRPVPLDLVVRLQPHRFHEPRFDEIEQTLVWPLEDAEGEALAAVVSFTRDNANIIQVIERWRPNSGDSLVGFYRPGNPDSFFPVAKIGTGREPAIEALAFAEVGEQSSWLKRLLGRGRSRDLRWTPPAGEVESFGDDAELTPLRQLLAPSRSALLMAAESGLAARLMPVDWEATCRGLATAGLVALARALGGAFDSPAALLRGAYLTGVYWRAD